LQFVEIDVEERFHIHGFRPDARHAHVELAEMQKGAADGVGNAPSSTLLSLSIG
jgi:hypothetical protein